MSFSENLQYLRKKENMTQEQLAERLEVSRQAVSKWESGQSYPEMDKLLQLCEMFHCSLDTLIQGDATREDKEDLAGYERQMNHFSLITASAVSLIITAIGLMVILEHLLQGIVNKDMLSILMFVMVGAAVSVLIVTSINHDYFRKRCTMVQDFYTEEERYQFNRKFAVAIAAGVCLILFGLCLNILLEQLGNPYWEEAGGGIFMFFVAAAVWIFIYFGLQKEKYEVEEYNRKNRNEHGKGQKLAEKISGVIMLLATALFLYLGMVRDMFGTAWVVFPIGGILCAVAGVIWGDKE